MTEKDGIYRERQPGLVFEVAALETWLEDRAQEGYWLTGFRGIWGHFRRERSCLCRYRLEPLLRRERTPDPECLETYAAMGWSYVTTLNKTFHVWRCEDPTASELDTDPEVQATGYRYLRRQMARRMALWLAVLVILAAAWVRSLRMEETPLWTVVRTYAPGTMTVWLLGLGACLLLVGMEWRTLTRLLRRLKAGIPLERPRPYRWQQRMGRVVGVLCVCLYCTNLADGLLGGFWELKQPEGTAFPALSALTPGVTQVEIERAEWKCQELAPRQRSIVQTGILPGAGRVYARTEQYRMLVKALAPAMERDLLIWCEKFNGHMETLPNSAWEYFSWGTDSEGVQFLVAGQGRDVLFLRYRGPTDLRTAGEFLAESLESA